MSHLRQFAKVASEAGCGLLAVSRPCLFKKTIFQLLPSFITIVRTKSNSVCVALVVVMLPVVSSATEQVTVGLGNGVLHAGLGVNVGRRTDSDLHYIAAGCPALAYTDARGFETDCGVGLGWVHTGFLSQANNKHGLGVYLGPVKGEIDRTVYGIGIFYDYFFKGISAPGWNLGGGVGKGYEDDANGLIFIQAGYQF